MDLSALANVTTSATALGNLILVTPNTNLGYQPQNPPNKDGTPSTAKPPPSLVFHYEGEQTVTLESDITDHYIEDNTAIQDNIALRPLIITTHGFIGELNDVVPKALEGVKKAADKLTVISAYQPVLSVTALRAYNTALQLYALAQNTKNAGVSAWSSLAGGQTQNKQQQMFLSFKGYWESRTLFTVQTPWAIFKDMAIKNLRAIQDEESMVITDFEIQFKQMKFASTLVANFKDIKNEQAGRAANQGGVLVDLGTGKTGPDVPFSTVAP